VIYTGLHQTPEMIAEAAVQEDADAVGLSVLSGAHMTLFPEVMRLLKERGASEVAVFGGGIIPDDDAVKLKEMGVRQIFTPGASTEDIVKWVRENVAARV
ncbi:MAG TPA: cobalamin-dependent protein, partial [Candidatus Binatus sp.]|nr:cobalamin-dependent protein [Candidatus Binatus sp.]